MYYESFGAGRPIVFLPGWGGANGEGRYVHEPVFEVWVEGVLLHPSCQALDVLREFGLRTRTRNQPGVVAYLLGLCDQRLHHR